MDSIDSQEIHAIFARIEQYVNISESETKADVEQKLLMLALAHRTQRDHRIMTLIDAGFPQKVVDLNLNRPYSIEVWKGDPTRVRKIARNKKGHFRKGQQVIYDMDDFLKNIEKYVDASRINETVKKIEDFQKALKEKMGNL